MHALRTLYTRLSLGALATMIVVALALLALNPTTIHAVEKCSFTRDLEMGVDGEDTRCLQKYLNSEGYTIAETGPGSPGNETTLFRGLTRAALIKWQEAYKISPASGYFGPLSRAAYDLVLDSGVSISGSGAVTTNQDAAKKQTETTSTAPAPQPVKIEEKIVEVERKMSDDEIEARKLIKDTIDTVRDAEDEIDDGDASAEDLASAKDDLADALEELFDAVRAFFKNDFEDARATAEGALDEALDAFEDAGGRTDKAIVDDLIDEVDDLLKEVEDEIDEAEDDDRDVDEAEELLEDAEKRLDKAKDAFDDKDYEEAEELADEAEDLARDAEDAIGDKVTKSDAKDEIDEADDDIDDARDEIDDAEDDGEDVDEAEDLLDEAEDLLREARDEFDDNDYKKAASLAKDAQRKAEDAIDEL